MSVILSVEKLNVKKFLTVYFEYHMNSWEGSRPTAHLFISMAPMVI
jgi:hypothetical protein